MALFRIFSVRVVLIRLSQHKTFFGYCLFLCAVINQIAVHLAAAGYVYDVFLCCPFTHKMSWMRSGTELS